MNETLLERIQSKTAMVGVVGLGYVGLPLCRAFAEAGYNVLGIDVDPTKIAKLEVGESYIDAVPSDKLSPLIKSFRLQVTTDFTQAYECDAIAICVPTPLTKHHDPDTSYIESAVESLGPNLSPDTLIVLESTTYPGTTDELLAPRLAELSRLELGKTLLVAYSPERENPGDKDWSTSKIPKVVGADDPLSLAVCVALYERAISSVVPASSTRVAEASKLLENIYRCVNIALVNELKICFEKMGIDVFEVVEAAKTKPFGFQAFYPGPGLGGHCIPIDPMYLSWKAREYGVRTRFIDLAGEVNYAMPSYVIERLTSALNDRSKSVNGSKILILGVAYKPNVDDIRESPASVLIKKLQEAGAEVSYYDPHVPHHYDFGLSSIELCDSALESADVVLIATDHEAVDYSRIVEKAQLIVDTRNATKDFREGTNNVVRA